MAKLSDLEFVEHYFAELLETHMCYSNNQVFADVTVSLDALTDSLLVTFLNFDNVKYLRVVVNSQDVSGMDLVDKALKIVSSANIYFVKKTPLVRVLYG